MSYEGHMSKRQKTDEGMHGIRVSIYKSNFCFHVFL